MYIYTAYNIVMWIYYRRESVYKYTYICIYIYIYT